MGPFLAPLLAHTVSVSMVSGFFVSYLVLQPEDHSRGTILQMVKQVEMGSTPVYSVLMAA